MLIIVPAIKILTFSVMCSLPFAERKLDVMINNIFRGSC